jgi:hypothetical protein
MIQYSSINDAWGNKEIYKKKDLNNIENLINKKLVNESFENKHQQISIVHEPKSIENQPKPIENQPKPIENQPKPIENQPKPIENQVKPIENQPKPIEHFKYDLDKSSCSFAEHLKTCEYCKNSLAEYFTNDNNNPISTINLFGLKINITKDVLKIIFVIIIIIIFVILLSIINISLKNPKTMMKYYMVPNMPNMHNMPNMSYYSH